MKDLDTAFRAFPKMANNGWVTTGLHRIVKNVQDLTEAVHRESCTHCFMHMEQPCEKLREIREIAAHAFFDEGQKEGERIKRLAKGG